MLLQNYRYLPELEEEYVKYGIFDEKQLISFILVRICNS